MSGLVYSHAHCQDTPRQDQALRSRPFPNLGVKRTPGRSVERLGSVSLVLVYNRAGRIDPTRTLGIRRRFTAEINRRFRALQKKIREAIVDQDVFGLGTASHPLHMVVPTPITLASAPPVRGQFNFPRSAQKVKAFMDWLEKQEQEYILSGGKSGIHVTHGPGQAGVEAAWTDTYIQSAYQQGMARARAEMLGRGYDVKPFSEIPGGINASFNTPFHADRAGLIFSRTYSDLKGITHAMDNSISKILGKGIAEGRNPLELARSINKTVSKIGIDRARTIARTEVIRAHNEATIQEYKEAKVLGLEIEAEFMTAGDGNVCSRCAELEGKIYTPDEAEGMLPIHPNCRCVFLPVDKTKD